jgi:hypothetical protein
MIPILLILVVCFLLTWFSTMPRPIQIVAFVAEAVTLLVVLSGIVPRGIW